MDQRIIEIVAPSDWSTVGPMQPIVVRAPPDRHLRAAFLKKVTWAQDCFSVEGVIAEFDTIAGTRGNFYMVHPTEPLPAGDLVVRVEDREHGLSPAFLGLVCSAQLDGASIEIPAQWTALSSAITFVTADAGSPDSIPESQQIETADVSEAALLQGLGGAIQRYVVRPLERHSLSEAQIRSESFWASEGIDFSHMRSRTNWTTPQTYLFRSADSIVNLKTGYVMPQPGTIWSDTVTSPWRDYFEPLKAGSGVFSVQKHLFFSPHLVGQLERFRQTAFHFCPPFHFTYGHWMTEALPSLWLLRDAIRSGAVIPISPPLSKWQLESIRGLGIDPGCIRFFDSEYVHCDDLISHSLFRMTTSWDQQPLADPFYCRPTIDRLETWGWGTAVRDTVRELQQRWGPRAGGRGPERIYIDRLGLTHPRRLTNGAGLATRLAIAGFSVVHPETLALSEEIDLFSNAKIVIGQQGSGFMNVAFAPPGCRVMEIVPDYYVYEHYRWWSALCGHTYARFVVRALEPPTVPWGMCTFDAPIEAILSTL